MKTKILEEVVCKNCNEKFTTENPNNNAEPCKCGKIIVDTTEFYARVIGSVRDYDFYSSNTENLNAWKKLSLDEKN